MFALPVRAPSSLRGARAGLEGQVRTADQLRDYENFMHRGAEVGFLQALDEWTAKARADGQREATLLCEDFCLRALIEEKTGVVIP